MRPVTNANSTSNNPTMRYIANTDTDRQQMLATIGLESLEHLFSDIPQRVKDRFEPHGFAAKTEMEVARALDEFVRSNNDWQASVSFLGGGIYDHYIPSVVSHLTSRSEFYTAYTPYQPEVSQGTLTTMFEFQTLVCELTAMDVANASMYDGATALAEGVLMAERIVGNNRVAVAKPLFSQFRRVVDTYCWAAGIDVIELPVTAEGRCDTANIPDDLSSLVIQSPNAFGVIEELDGLKDALGKALLIVVTNPISLGLLAPPGQFGADIVVAEGQPLGITPSFGGPLLGLFATRKQHLRQMPGRIAGQTVDTAGKIGYTMAAQTREQHIRRERATSNICTNSALCALAATVYLASLGASGLKEVARLNLEKAHYLAQQITSLPGYRLAFQSPFFNEFTIQIPTDPQQLRATLQEEGFLVDDPIQLANLGMAGALRFAVTEKRIREDLDRLVKRLGEIR